MRFGFCLIACRCPTRNRFGYELPAADTPPIYAVVVDAVVWEAKPLASDGCLGNRSYRPVVATLRYVDIITSCFIKQYHG